ncbi:hypothetical protein BDN72DRAFT_945437 [Pluteus cervinus]|uniref:Uncharacterized protein n=1 Tax=Pluteus cervinus TaxID=181527 RepID=A0ACD3AW79_9AGAR|nr:hypothetical protein BDN72DRAFT_945437 [Pluteus cervinus]
MTRSQEVLKRGEELEIERKTRKKDMNIAGRTHLAQFEPPGNECLVSLRLLSSQFKCHLILLANLKEHATYDYNRNRRRTSSNSAVDGWPDPHSKESFIRIRPQFKEARNRNSERKPRKQKEELENDIIDWVPRSNSESNSNGSSEFHGNSGEEDGWSPNEIASVEWWRSEAISESGCNVEQMLRCCGSKSWKRLAYMTKQPSWALGKCLVFGSDIRTKQRFERCAFTPRNRAWRPSQDTPSNILRLYALVPTWQLTVYNGFKLTFLPDSDGSYGWLSTLLVRI